MTCNVQYTPSPCPLPHWGRGEAVGEVTSRTDSVRGKRQITLGLVLGAWLAIGLLLMGCGTSPKETPEKPKYLVLVELTASDCGSCQEIHRIVQTLKDRYAEKITFVTLDITDAHNKRFAAETARRFHGEAMVHQHQDRPGTVVLLDARNGEAVGQLQNNTDATRYEALLQTAITEK